jgi:tetratricopeptide (TPR) repeat protein
MVAEGRDDRFAESERIAESGLELARRAGLGAWESEFLGARVEPLIQLGRWDEAVEAAAEIERADETGASVWDLGVHENLALMHAWRGDVASARAHAALLDPLATSDSVEMRVTHAQVEATVLTAEGRYRDALQLAEKALEGSRPLGGITNPNARAALVVALGAAAALGDAVTVERLVDQVQQVRPGESTPALRAHGARAAARLAALRGENVPVAPSFAAAAAIFRELPSPYWLAVTLAEHGEWLVAQDRAGEAEPLLAEATEIFERLGATVWVERLSARARRTEEIPA